MTLDTSLYKLTRNAYAILSGAYAKLPEIAIEAIDVPNTPKQPRLYNQLIQVSTLFRQINTHIVYNNDNTAIIGIQGENVQRINDLLLCLRDVAELTSLDQFPTPFTNLDFTQIQYIPILPGPLGSILVSDGNAWQILEMGADGSVLTATPTGLIYSSVVGNGLPSGGLAGQFLIKNTNNSYDVIWSSLTLNQITDIDETPEELNVLDGVDTVNIGSSQINTLVGINTGTTIQIQLDSKMGNALPNGQFWVGNALDVATPVAPTGDVIFNNTGLFSIQPLVIVDADVNTTAAINRTKLASGNSNRLVINDNAGVMADANAIFPARALISDSNGIPTHSGTTATALGYISTLTSDAQNQLNNKLTVVISSVAQGDLLTYNGTNWVNLPVGTNGEVLTTDGTSVSWGSSTANGIPVGGTAEQVLRKIDATNYNTEWHTLVMADITDVTTSAAEINLIDGLTVNATQLNYTSDVTDNIQEQLNNKLSTTLAHHSLFVGGPSDTAIMYGPGPEGSVLTIIAGHPIWQTPPPPGAVSGVSPTTDDAIVRWNGTAGDSLQNSVVIISDTGDITGVNSLTSGQIDILDQDELRLHETASTNYVGIRASTAMGSNYTITLPDAAPGSNTSLTYDGANYVWGASGGATAFLDLTDVDEPDYVGHAGQVVVVNGTEDGLIFMAGGGTGTVTSVTGTPDRIAITGTAADPIVNIALTYVGQNTITTLGTITTGVWNGTDVALSAGGTGASLSAPGVDRIFFYDQSALSAAFLEVGSGLSISGTVLTATGSYNDESAQDAVGNIFVDSPTIDFTYNDATPSITAIVINNSIDDSKLRAGTALSLIGRSVNSPGNVSDISASTNGYVMRRFADTIGFGLIPITSMEMNTNRILGRTTAAVGEVEELTVTNGLTLSSGSIRFGGSLIQDTSLTGGGFALTGSGFSTIQFSASNDIFLGTSIGSSIWIQDNVLQHLILGAVGGAELHLGGDATGDIYYRNGSGKFVQRAIGSVGQVLITSTTGVPTWSNMIQKLVIDMTYEFTDDDNGKLIVFTHGGGCTATIPNGGILQPQWQVLCYRLGGTVTFTSSATMEGIGTTMPVVETMAAIIQRDTDIFALSGSLSLIGSGTVTSVGLNHISGLATSSGGPIIASGDFTLTLDNQLANYFFSGPSTTGSAAPTFRAMVLKDLPDDTWSQITGLTYTIQQSDNKKVLYTTQASGTIITVPSTGLSVGFSCTVYRMPSTGPVSFISDGTSVLEGTSFVMSNEETLAIVAQRILGTFVFAGDLGVSPGGGTITTADNGLQINPLSNVQLGGQLTEATTLIYSAGAANALHFGGYDPSNKLSEYVVSADYMYFASDSGGIDFISETGSVLNDAFNFQVSLASGGYSSLLQGSPVRMRATKAVPAADRAIVGSTFHILNRLPATSDTAQHALSGFGVKQEFNLQWGTSASQRIEGAGISYIADDVTIGSIDGHFEIEILRASAPVQIATLGDNIEFNALTDITLTAGDDLDLDPTGDILLNGVAPSIPATQFIRGDKTWAVPGFPAGYTGATSITTLGTITTGTWNATTIGTAYGGTGRTTIGTANQILGVNNAATALEYKTLSLGTTAQSNNLGWVLTGANAAVLHVPDASATVRGVVTTGAQTFAGAKTFANTPTFSSMTSGSVLFAGTAGILSQDNGELFWDNTNNWLGIGTATPLINLHIIDNIGLPVGIRIQNLQASNSSTVQFLNDVSSSSTIQFTASAGGGSGLFTSNQLIVTGGATNGILVNTSTSTPIVFSTNHTVDLASSARMRITDIGVKIGNNTTATARLHVIAGTSTVAPFKLTTGTAVTPITGGVNDGAFEYHSSHLYFTIGSTRYQIDQQSGTLSDGDKGDITVSASGATWTIDNDAVTYAKIQNVVNNNRFLGRISGAGGDVEELTGTQGTSLLDLFSTSAATKGLVPGSNSVGATFFLNATGAWSVPAGGGGTPGGSNTHVQFNNAGAFGGNSGMTYAESPSGTFGLSLGVASTTNIGKITLGGATGSGNITANADLSINLAPVTNGFRIIMSGTNRFQLNNNGAALFNSLAGTSGQVLTSAGTGASPTWTTPFTNTAGVGELAMSDGINLDPSGLFVPAAGSLNFGDTSLAGTDRNASVSGSGTNINFNLYSKGTGNIVLGMSSGSVVIGADFLSGDRAITTGSSSTNADLTISAKAAADIRLYNAPGILTSVILGDYVGRSLLYRNWFISANELLSRDDNFYIGSESGFDVIIGYGGNNVSFFNQLTYTTQDGVIGIGNAQIVPAAAIAGAIQLYAQDVVSSGLSTLGIYAEEAVEATGTFTQTHRFKIKINGTEYWLSLDAV